MKRKERVTVWDSPCVIFLSHGFARLKRTGNYTWHTLFAYYYSANERKLSAGIIANRMCVPSVNSEAGNRLLVIAGASLSLYRLSVSRRYNSEDLPAITNDFLFHLLTATQKRGAKYPRVLFCLFC